MGTDLAAVLLFILYLFMAASAGTALFVLRSTVLIPYTLFTGLLALSFGAYLFGPLALPAMSTTFIAYFLGVWLVFTVGYFWGLLPASERKPIAAPTEGPEISVTALNVVSALVVVVVCVFSLYKVYLFSGGNVISYFLNSEEIRYRFFQFNFTGAPIPYSLLEYIAYGVTGIAVLGWYSFARNPKALYNQPALYLPILGSLLLSVIGFSRTPFILTMALSVAAFLIGRPTFLLKGRGPVRVFALSLVAVGLWIGLNWVAVVRDNGVQLSYQVSYPHLRDKFTYSPFAGIFFSNYLYLTTSMVNFSDRLDSAALTVQLQWGAHSFASLISPLRTLGVPVKTFDDIFSDSGPTLRSLLGYDITLNAPTAFDAPVQDWGVTGSLVYVLLLAFVTARLISTGSRLTSAKLFILTTLVLWIVMSPFVNVYSISGKAILSGAFFVLLVSRISQGSRAREHSVHPPTNAPLGVGHH